MPAGEGMGGRPHGRVLVIDRRTLFADVLAAALTRAGFVAHSAPLGSRAVGHDVVLLDGDRDVSQIADDVVLLRLHDPRVKVLLLVADGSTLRRGLARRVGAAGCVSRSALLPDLVTYLRRGRGPVPEPRTEGIPGQAGSLTEREVDVLQALAGGASTHGAARTLGISPNTVRTHLQNIHAKLGVSTRLAAVASARDAGLLPGQRRQPVGA